VCDVGAESREPARAVDRYDGVGVTSCVHHVSPFERAAEHLLKSVASDAAFDRHLEGSASVRRGPLIRGSLVRTQLGEGRQHKLFFAQLEATETIIFLHEAREDLRQGLGVPWDLRPDGSQGFRRYASKMATGAGKTTVMGMLSAWSILNKVDDRGDVRFSDTVLS
jgi:hypothetical protein